MSQPQGDVATSFGSHFFSSGRNLSSLLQPIFLLPTFIPGRYFSLLVETPVPIFMSRLQLYVATPNGAFHLKTSCNFVLLLH